MTYKYGKLQGGEMVWREKEAGPLTYYQKIVTRQNYATYDVTVAAFTDAGDGPSVPQSVGKEYLVVLSSA